MGKLNIAHHKSYHPYRRDNIEKVRRDEEEARLKEQQEEGRMMLADAEARIDLLRQRTGVSNSSEKKKKRLRDDDDMKYIASSSSMQTATLPTTDGHINLFGDLEQTQKAIAAAIRATKKSATAEEDKGVPLAPAPKDLKPWYSGKDKLELDEGENERRQREEYRKSVHDPLTSITKQLASKTALSSSRTPRQPQLLKEMHGKQFDVQSRLARESSERQRALDLVRRKKREMEGNSTPSTVADDFTGGYGDVFNRQEVEEAHMYKDRRREGGYGHRRWDDDERGRNGRGSRRW